MNNPNQNQIGLDLEERDAVLGAHRRRELIVWLELELYRWATWLGDPARGHEVSPVSANTARRVLATYAFELEEPRILGGLFPPSRWEQAGEATSDSGKCHQRRIRTFTPKLEAASYFAAGARVGPPAWLGPKRDLAEPERKRGSR